MLSEIKNYIKLHPNEALFIFVGDSVMPQPHYTMSQICKKNPFLFTCCNFLSNSFPFR